MKDCAQKRGSLQKVLSILSKKLIENSVKIMLQKMKQMLMDGCGIKRKAEKTVKVVIIVE